MKHIPEKPLYPATGHKDFSIEVAPTDEETRLAQTRRLSELPEIEVFMEVELKDAFDYMREGAPEFIIHEFPRPSYPGVPFRLIRSAEGDYWTDINGNRVRPPDLDKIPTNPWVSSEAKPFIFKTPDKNFLARRIALRETKIRIVRQHLDSALGEDRLRYGRKLGGLVVWQKRDRERLSELRK